MKTLKQNSAEMQALKKAYQAEPDKKKANRIQVIRSCLKGLDNRSISDLFLVSIRTIRRYKRVYKKGGIPLLLQCSYKGSTSTLSEEDKSWLKEHVSSHVYSRAIDIAQVLYEHKGKRLSSSFLCRVLKEMGFSYKKTKLVPGKMDVAEQEKWLKKHKRLKSSLSAEESLYFLDSAHPTHNTENGYAWIERGKEQYIPTNTGRKRICINGALNSETKEVIWTQTSTTNADTIIELLEEIEKKNPHKKRIHVVCDNAGYLHSKKVKQYLKTSRMRLHYLPAYSPNLNIIERLWKYMKGKVIRNRYYEKVSDFSDAISEFLNNLHRYKDELRTLLTDNFQLYTASAQ